MSSSNLVRLSAVAGILSGLALAIGAVLDVPATWLHAQILFTLSAVLLLCLLPAAYLMQRQESGALGGLGFIVILLGTALVALNWYTLAVGVHFLPEGVQSELWETYLGKAWRASEVVSLLGVILFCVATFRAAVFPRPAPILFTVGYAIFVLLHILSPDAPYIVFAVARVMAGIGIIWLGYGVWSHER